MRSRLGGERDEDSGVGWEDGTMGGGGEKLT